MIVEQLLSQTLFAQSSLNDAINASATLLLAAAIYGQSQAGTTIMDTEAVLRGYGLDSLQRSAEYIQLVLNMT